MPNRLYMDVHVPAAVTEGLRRRGVDVVTSQDDGSRRIDDEAILARTTELDRVLFTEDADFLAIAAAWQSDGREFPGVIYSHQLGPGIGRIVDDLDLLMQCMEPEELRNRVLHLPLR